MQHIVRRSHVSKDWWQIDIHQTSSQNSQIFNAKNCVVRFIIVFFYDFMHLWWNFWSNLNRVWRTIFWCQKELWFLTSVFRSIFQNDSVALRRARFWLVLVNNEMQPAWGSPIIFWSVTTWVNYQRAIYNARLNDFPWCSLFFNQRVTLEELYWHSAGRGLMACWS